MKTVLVICLLLAGCGTVAGVALPSIDACDKVNYQREGSKVTLYAECGVKR